MNNNPTGIGVCGVVVGIILGAGAMVYTSDYSVRANLTGSLLSAQTVVFRGMDIEVDRQFYSKRAVTERYLEEHGSAEVLEGTPQRNTVRTPAVEPVAEPRTDACQEPIDLKAKVLGLIPIADSYERLRVKVSMAFDQTVQYCEERTAQVQASKASETQVKSAAQAVSPKPRVNNHCEQYDKTSQRYTRCIGNEREGQRYIGRQSQQ